MDGDDGGEETEMEMVMVMVMMMRRMRMMMMMMMMQMQMQMQRGGRSVIVMRPDHRPDPHRQDDPIEVDDEDLEEELEDVLEGSAEKQRIDDWECRRNKMIKIYQNIIIKKHVYSGEYRLDMFLPICLP